MKKEKTIKLYAPKYYKNFKCIADKCEHSCCIEAYDEEDFCERFFASLVYSEKAKGLEEISKLSSIISEEIEYSEDNTSALTFALPSTENLGN